jgi:hypothetical protein
MKKILLIIIMFSITFSCTNVSEDDLIEAEPLPETVTYQADVKVIIDNNCIMCHNNPPINGAPMSLLLYENVKDAVEDRDLIGRITGTSSGPSMPFGGPMLPQNLIDIIIHWEADGLLEE